MAILTDDHLIANDKFLYFEIFDNDPNVFVECYADDCVLIASGKSLIDLGIKKIFDTMPNLKCVSTVSAGYDHLGMVIDEHK